LPGGADFDPAATNNENVERRLPAGIGEQGLAEIVERFAQECVSKGLQERG